MQIFLLESISIDVLGLSEFVYCHHQTKGKPFYNAIKYFSNLNIINATQGFIYYFIAFYFPLFVSAQKGYSSKINKPEVFKSGFIDVLKNGHVNASAHFYIKCLVFALSQLINYF